MRVGRIPVIHLLIVVVVVIVAIAGFKSQQFGINRQNPSGRPAALSASPVALAAQNRIIETARTMRQQGRYEEAIAELHAVVAAGNAASAGAAMLEIAKNDIALGNDSAALTQLNQLRSNYPQSPESDEAQFQISQLEAKQGALSSAMQDLQDYRKRHPDIGAYLDLLLAGYAANRGDLDQALSLARSVALAPVATRARADALEKMREIELKRKQYAAYLDTTNRLLALATIPSYRAELTYERAGSEIHLGQIDAALVDLRRVIEDHPDSSYATSAITDLTKLSGSAAVSDEQRGLVDYYRGDYQTAERRFTSVLSTSPNSDAAWYYRAMSVLNGGDGANAAVELREMVSRFPNSALTPKALITAGRLYEESGDLAAAQSSYEAVIAIAPHSVEATNGRLRLGIILYQKNEFPDVVSILSPVHGSSTAQAQASFWEGKAFQQIGQADKAAQAWKDAEMSDPSGFYGLRANQLRSGEQPTVPAPPNASVDSPLTSDDRAALAAWFALNGTTEDTVRATVQQDPAYQRLDLLYELGLSSQAEWEMSDLADRYSHDPYSLAALGELLSQSGHYNAAYRIGIRLQIVSDNGGLHLPDALQRLAFPIAYPALVQQQASTRAIDPYLLLALMRQESGYDPTVTSSADARGLTQVVPATAAELASALKINDWNPDKLYRPAIAIQLGAVFLADRLQKYDGQTVPALAGYNAGDGNVAKWLSNGSVGDPDVFLERITFPETHDYVKFVVANYLNYLRLYR